MGSKFHLGESVIFNRDYIEDFISETNASEELRQYQKIILAGIDQAGVVKEFLGNLTTVTYPDGWETPVPTKYLLHNTKV